MIQWKWVNRKVLLLLHDENLAVHGGASGLRDKGLLDSALARPVNLALDKKPDVAGLAASYGVGLARNHTFFDGNKRVAFLAAGLFFIANGYRLRTPQAEAILTMLDVAAGVVDEVQFARWLREHTAAR